MHLDHHPSPSPSRVRWQIVGLLMALCLISHFNRSSMSIAGTDRIMEEYSISPTRMGWVYSSFLFVYTLAMIPGGLFIDRFGPRRALMVVGFGSAVFCALTGVTGWVCASTMSLLLSLMMVRGLMGLVSAPLHPAAARSIASWIPSGQRSGANGLVTAAAILGNALSPVGFAALIVAVDWRLAFVVSAGATILLTSIWAMRATDRPAQHPAVNRQEKSLIEDNLAPNREKASPAPFVERQEGRGLFANRSLVLLTFSYAAIGYFQYLFVYWMPFYLDKVLHVGAMESKYYASVPQVALAIAMPLGGWLSGHLAPSLGVRRARAFVSGGGMVIGAVLLGLGVLAKDPFWIVVWFALSHGAIGASEGPFWATAVEIGGVKGGTTAAICNTGGNLGGMLAPILTPWISSQWGWGAGIGLGGIICFLGALCWCGVNPAGSKNAQK